MVRSLVSIAVLMLLASCGGAGGGGSYLTGGPPDTTWAACDLYPSQQSIADHYRCQRRQRGQD